MTWTIKNALLSVLVTLGILAAGSAVKGLQALGAANKSLRLMYLDRVVPLRDLKNVSVGYAGSVVETAHKVKAGVLSWEDGARIVRSGRETIEGDWASYMATEMGPQEKSLADDVAQLVQAADPFLIEFEEILARKDTAGLDKFVMETLDQRIGPIIVNLAELSNMQVDIAAGIYKQAQDAYGQSRTISFTLILISMIGGAIVLLIILRKVTDPITALTGAMTQLAKGDLATRVPSTESRDEVGDMARAVLVFKQHAEESARLRQEQEALKVQAEQDRRAAMLDMAARFEESVNGVVQAVNKAASDMQDAAQALATAADEANSQAVSVAAAAEEASANVSTVAGATEQLTASIQEISRQIRQSTGIAGQAVGEAQVTTTVIDELSENARKIGEIVTLINSIASQTNLLALNATIEAARAGEVGKGFAVVASEVKALAMQTAKATDEIATQAQDIQAATSRAGRSIGDISETIAQMNDIATGVSAAIEEQRAATQDIAANIAQASAGTSEVSSNIVGVTQATTETGTAASEVLEASASLSAQASRLSEEVERFLSSIRAA